VAPERTRLLVVDDEEGLLFLITDVLRREGYEVEGLDSGEAALEWLRTQKADLLLLDLKLTDLPAPVLIERLRAQGRVFPFMVITGHGDERTAVDVMKQGALDYVMKDKGLLELLPSIVRRALGTVERERRLAEANEALREREQRHRRIIQTALDGFARFDAMGQFLEVNEALSEMLGCPVEEILKMNVSEVESAGSTGEFRKWIAGGSGPTGRFVTRLRRGDESTFEVEVSLRREGVEVFGFVHDISRQRRLEREVLQLSEDERRRIGRDLHDGLGQQLTALEMMSHALTRDLKTQSPDLVAPAAEIASCARQAITQARQLAHGLAPVALEADGLMTALYDLASMTTRAGVDCDFECEAVATVNDSAAATHLYRIAQEAVNNALKHADAGQIIIKLQDVGDAIELSISDDGCGLPPGAVRSGGMGLQLIEYRAHLIGARLEIRSRPGKGVEVACSLPKQS
jgi:two-component system sensor kinase FixL